MERLTEALFRADVLSLVSMLAIVALATVSLVLLWEGVSRWLREREAEQALQRIRGGDDSGRRGRTTVEAPRALLDEQEPWGPRWLQAIVLRLPHRDDLQKLLEQAGRRRWSVGTLLLVCLGLGLSGGLVVLTFVGALPFVLAGAACGAYLPIAYLKILRTRRFAAYEENFPEAIDLLARAARAGHSLAAGLQVVAEEGEEPVASEFGKVYDEQRFGMPMQEALLGLADRIDLVDVRIFVTAVMIQRESGGNLAENLDGLSDVIRGRFRFRRDVKTKTAHGRITGLVVALAPVVAGIGMYALNPEYMRPLFVEPLGQMMLLIGFVMMTIGFVVIRRMVDIQI